MLSAMSGPANPMLGVGILNHVSCVVNHSCWSKVDRGTFQNVYAGMEGPPTPRCLIGCFLRVPAFSFPKPTNGAEVAVSCGHPAVDRARVGTHRLPGIRRPSRAHRNAAASV